MEYYRAPFIDQYADKPLRQYLRDLPRGDGKSKADKLIAENAKKLVTSKLPKLMLYSVPGFITTIETAMWAKKYLPRLEIADIGESLHYAQETDPFLMGETMSIWLQGIEQARDHYPFQVFIHFSLFVLVCFERKPKTVSFKRSFHPDIIFI